MPKDEHYEAREKVIEDSLVRFLRLKPSFATCAAAWRAAFEAGESFATETVLKHYSAGQEGPDGQ